MNRILPAAVAAILWLAMMPAAAQAPDFSALLDDEDQVTAGEEMEELTSGDMKQFKVTTDSDISALEVGDIYKNNTSFFAVSKIGSKGKEGGTFVVQRVSGNPDPGRDYTRVSGIASPTIIARETLWDRFIKGGPLMYPIALLLLGVIVIAVNSGMVYRRKKQYPDELIDQATHAIVNDDMDRFEGIANEHGGLLAAIYRRMAINLADSTEQDIRIRCESEARKQIGFLRMPLRGLTFIAAVAPLLGLLGTVVGMIECFDGIGSDVPSASKSQAMASGIKVALLTTAFGLCVAVPALFVYFVYNLKLNVIIADCEGTAAEMVHQMAKLKRRAAA